MEVSSLAPVQVSAVLLSLLASATGGHRPIGVFCSIYRTWGKSRRKYAMCWEDRSFRACFAAAKLSSSTDVVWRQTVRAECEVARGRTSATLFWDLYKCVELVDLTKLRNRCREYGFPPAIAGLAICFYRSARFAGLGGTISGPAFANHGIIAGCSFATTRSPCLHRGPVGQAGSSSFGFARHLYRRLRD
eukprot:9471055-Pyramimonas_sp.AAC.1